MITIMSGLMLPSVRVKAWVRVRVIVKADRVRRMHVCAGGDGEDVAHRGSMRGGGAGPFALGVLSQLLTVLRLWYEVRCRGRHMNSGFQTTSPSLRR